MGQCARDVKFVKGEANIKDWKINTNDPFLNSGSGSMGSCCAEMDLWEANTMATAFTAHPSTKEGLFICNGDSECGAQDGDRYIAPTDRDGCDINSYRLATRIFTVLEVHTQWTQRRNSPWSHNFMRPVECWRTLFSSMCKMESGSTTRAIRVCPGLPRHQTSALRRKLCLVTKMISPTRED